MIDYYAGMRNFYSFLQIKGALRSSSSKSQKSQDELLSLETCTEPAYWFGTTRLKNLHFKNNLTGFVSNIKYSESQKN